MDPKHITIPSDSKNGNDSEPMTITPSNNPIKKESSDIEGPSMAKGESDPEEDTEPEEESDEEEPSEYEAETEPESPPAPQTRSTPRPRTRGTARKHVPISIIPPTDPSMTTPTKRQRVDTCEQSDMVETLQTWRNEENFHNVTEVGESSAMGQRYPFTREPPYHTIPLIVTRMKSHEVRMEQLEENHQTATSLGTIKELQDYIQVLLSDMREMREITQKLMDKVEKLERSEEQLQYLAHCTRTFATHISKQPPK